MFNQNLLLIYRLFISKGGRRANWIEERFGFDGGIALSPDDRRNELYAYETLFSPGQKAELEQLYLELLDEMNGVPYPQCGELLDALAFIQEISATALWKYCQRGGGVVENFVRDFDRLDLSDERIRLYDSAQKH
jgi:hypothetical protein